VGILPWQLFSSAFSDSSNSLITNSSLITKVYFPRLLVPLSAMAVSLIDFAISCVLLILMMFWYNVHLSLRVLSLPFFVCLALMASSALGIWMAALTVKYRDFRHLSPFFLQLGLYISPVGFSSSVIPGKWRGLYYLNPLALVIDGFRWALLENVCVFNWKHVFISFSICSLLLITGVLFFGRVERNLVDVI
jgi:lipopolysaccharide transport system permease protein